MSYGVNPGQAVTLGEKLLGLLQQIFTSRLLFFSPSSGVNALSICLIMILIIIRYVECDMRSYRDTVWC